MPAPKHAMHSSVINIVWLFFLISSSYSKTKWDESFAPIIPYKKYTKQSFILQCFYRFIFKYFLAANKDANPPIKAPARMIENPTWKLIALGLNRANIGVNSFPSKLSYSFSYPKCTNKYGTIDPSSPIKMPSTINGLLMKPFVAPTVRIIMISSLLESIVVRIVL